jgi:hypothetical protein
MIIYWIIVALKRAIWLVRIPKPEQLARADINERCPVCGWTSGRVRCVLKAKPGPRAANQLPDGQILRQHACNNCGARWHHAPLAKGVDATKVLPSVARNDLEAKEDRQAYMQSEETVNQ